MLFGEAANRVAIVVANKNSIQFNSMHASNARRVISIKIDVINIKVVIPLQEEKEKREVRCRLLKR